MQLVTKSLSQGFQFVKGKSRLKKCASSSDDTPAPKRRKSSQDIRDKRMKEIEEDCQDLSDRISFKEKIIVVCENVRDYKKCDELKEEVTALKKQRRQLESELKCIKKPTPNHSGIVEESLDPVSHLQPPVIRGVQHHNQIVHPPHHQSTEVAFCPQNPLC